AGRRADGVLVAGHVAGGRGRPVGAEGRARVGVGGVGARAVVHRRRGVRRGGVDGDAQGARERRDVAGRVRRRGGEAVRAGGQGAGGDAGGVVSGGRAAAHRHAVAEDRDRAAGLRRAGEGRRVDAREVVAVGGAGVAGGGQVWGGGS